MKNIIFIITITVIIVILPSSVFAQTATLSLNPASGTFNQSCSFSLNIDLDSGGTETDGADAILLYDTSRFTATSITKGTIYPDYPGNNIDASSGKITVSGLASVSTPFSGKGTLITVQFTVVPTAPAGVTQIKFDFDPNDKAKTTDSNVVQRGTVVDVLNSVVDGSYTIGSGSCAQVSPAPGGSTNPLPAGRGSVGTDSAQPKSIVRPTETKQPVATLPPAGLEGLTFNLAIVGGVLTVLGILGLALL
ncbi:hypothetical protein HY383_03540 [Candidatus Daviesbacteria bacterium]|nr:hypothetical protein [Candidatus Daviesbacteria bacterium]